MSNRSHGGHRESGGFKSTLALIISIIALVLSYLAYSSSQDETDLEKNMKDLQTKVEGIKKESAKQITKLRGETANALDKLSEKVKSKKGEK